MNQDSALYFDYEYGVVRKCDDKSVLGKIGGYSKTNEQKESKVTTKTLYEIKRGDQIFFGTKLAVNSQGQWVMELKGSGEVLAVDKDSVSKVVPFTVAIKFTESGSTYHYLADANAGWQKDDFVIMGGYNGGAYQIARIIDIDTKNENATADFKPYKKI